jgi:hypothetical protein
MNEGPGVTSLTVVRCHVKVTAVQQHNLPTGTSINPLCGSYTFFAFSSPRIWLETVPTSLSGFPVSQINFALYFQVFQRFIINLIKDV